MKKQIFFLILFFFLINLVWEVAHTPLYKIGNMMTGTNYMIILLYASFMDALLITIIFLIISIKNKNLKWFNNPSKVDYLFIIFLGIIIAIFIELRALTTGRWSYNNLMPTIFTIGLTPLIQLFTTAILSIQLVKKIN